MTRPLYGPFIFDSWDAETFPNRMQSIRYHLQKHGNGRTYTEYTRDAIDFFLANKSKAKDVVLQNRKPGLSLKLKTNGGRQGGHWTQDGKIVTYWD